MQIYSMNDRIKINIKGKIEIEISPLNYLQKVDVAEALVNKPLKGAFLAIKYAIRGIRDCTKAIDNSEYKLTFDGDVLSDNCADELMNSKLSEELQWACIAFLKNIPDKITDANGEPMEGITIVDPTKGKTKKRTSSR